MDNDQGGERLYFEEDKHWHVLCAGVVSRADEKFLEFCSVLNRIGVGPSSMTRLGGSVVADSKDKRQEERRSTEALFVDVS